MNAQRKPPHKGNLRIALVLVAIAAFFFASVILKRLWLS
ncbi:MULTISPECIES: cytochrome oxidase small assembly protein [Massilia]|uniref:Cytochrome oxidase small assembly protein n=1 Tax=Massilia haematophila TaxID=457923 RepID=A0ABV7PTF1_9BURK|nr:cytochrome oxidase small assembly protein [Massilia sp.]